MLKVLLKAKRIPDGSVVSKSGGEKKYTLKFNVKIYSEAGNTTITAEKGTVFLVGSDAINAVSEDCELKWHVEEEVLLDWIHWQQDGLDEID